MALGRLRLPRVSEAQQLGHHRLPAHLVAGRYGLKVQTPTPSPVLMGNPTTP